MNHINVENGIVSFSSDCRAHILTTPQISFFTFSGKETTVTGKKMTVVLSGFAFDSQEIMGS